MEIVADERSFRAVADALAEEADGRELRADLAADLRAVLAPAVSEVRGALMAMPTSGVAHGGEPLRQAVSDAITVDVRFGGKSAGAQIRVRTSGMPRNFGQAPRRLNSRRGWRHPVFGRDLWVTQLGAPGWFDDTLARGRSRYRAAAEHALDSSAARIARRGRS